MFDTDEIPEFRLLKGNCPPVTADTTQLEDDHLVERSVEVGDCTEYRYENLQREIADRECAPSCVIGICFKVVFLYVTGTCSVVRAGFGSSRSVESGKGSRLIRNIP